MNDRQLAYVVAIVEEGSFTEAAVRCGVTQPSLSAAVGRLERELGVELFHRIGRRVIPTDACDRLLPSARDVIRSTRAARESVGEVRSGRTGHLDVAVQPTVIGAVVDLLAEQRVRDPGVTLRVHSPAGDSIADLVASGRAEIGIGDVGDPRTDLVWRELWTETYVCVDRPDDPPTRAGRCDARQLADTPLIATPPGSPTRDVLDTWFSTAGVAPRIVLEVDHREALLPLIAAGCGAALVPHSFTAAVAGASLRVRTLAPRVERRIAVAHRDTALTPAAQRFHALAVAHRRRR